VQPAGEMAGSVTSSRGGLQAEDDGAFAGELQELQRRFLVETPSSLRAWLAWQGWAGTNQLRPLPEVDSMLGAVTEEPLYHVRIRSRLAVLSERRPTKDHNEAFVQAPAERWTACCEHWWRHLHDKGTHQALTAHLGIEARPIFARGRTPLDVPAHLPSSYCLRPRRGHSGQGVMLVRNGRCLESGRRVGRPEVVEHLRRALLQTNAPGFLIEPLLTAPRDIQFFMFGGVVGCVRVVLKNKRQQFRTEYRTESWEKLRLWNDEALPPVDDTLPDGYSEMRRAAIAIGRFVRAPVRVDFLSSASDRVWCFGELCFSPRGAVPYNYGVERLLGAAWQKFCGAAT
jgi:hypothetical protein